MRAVYIFCILAGFLLLRGSSYSHAAAHHKLSYFPAQQVNHKQRSAHAQSNRHGAVHHTTVPDDNSILLSIENDDDSAFTRKYLLPVDCVITLTCIYLLGYLLIPHKTFWPAYHYASHLHVGKYIAQRSIRI